MAQESSEAKTHDPTPRRLRQMRERGHVAKSKELSGALSLLCTLLCVVGMAPWAAKQLADYQLIVDRTFEALTFPAVEAVLMQGLVLMAQLSLIPLGVAAVVFLLSSWLQTGSVFSLELAKPMLSRINPVEGASRLFSLRSLVQLALTLFKASIIAAAAALVCANTLGDAVRVIYADAGAALTVANAALMRLTLWCGGLFFLLGLLDLTYQRWQYLKDLRMSFSEVRREQKDDQGDGKVKSQRKGFAKESSPKEQLAFMHMASLVVSDMDGRVTALIYRPKQYPLPLCLVRGNEEIGAEILALALQNKVPAVVDSGLLGALYSTQVGTPIPSKSLSAVLGYLQMAAA